MSTQQEADLHNRVAHEAVDLVVSEMCAAGADRAAVMAALESIVVGVVLDIEQLHGCTRRDSAEAVETLTHRVLERLAEREPPR